MIGLPRTEADGAEADIAGSVDDLPRPRYRGVGTDEEIRVDETELAVTLESDLAAIDAGADDEVVVVTEHLVVVEGLQRCACRQPLREGPVHSAPRRGRAGISSPRRARHPLLLPLDDLQLCTRPL